MYFLFLHSILETTHNLGSNSTPNQLASACIMFKQVIQLKSSNKEILLECLGLLQVIKEKN